MAALSFGGLENLPTAPSPGAKTDLISNVMRSPMQTEFRAIVQSEYGALEKVLRIAKRQLKSEELGTDDALVKVIARPIHHGDIQILSALPQGGPVEPIPEGTLRVPGFEGVGTIVRLGTNAKGAKRFS